MILAILGLLCAGAAPAPAGERPVLLQEAQQAQEVDEATRKKIDRFFELAKTGRIPVRPQAARRLVKLGAPAAQKIVGALGEGSAGLVEFGPYLVEELADFERPELRARLWTALDDRDFPWRAPAARGLARAPREDEAARLLALCDDAVAQVRRAAVGGLGGLGASAERRERLRLLTEDVDEHVRRDAAAQLDAWGEHRYLLWLVAELERTDDYFGVPYGEKARFEALRTLKKRLGGDFGFAAENEPTDDANRVALEGLRAAALARAGVEAVELPQLARPAAGTPGDLIGLELRSCRAGDLFLRWNAEDRLYVGTGTPLVLDLPSGSAARLRQALFELTEPLEERFWGEAGCDLEQLRLVDGEGKTRIYLVSKGQAAVPDLRPEPLNACLRALLADLPAEGSGAGDPRLSDLRERVRAALLVVGGEYRGA